MRIEAYDVAHISGKYLVGVMTVVSDGEPDKSEYRKFKIKTVAGANDTASLAEVLERRFAHPEEFRAVQLFTLSRLSAWRSSARAFRNSPYRHAAPRRAVGNGGLTGTSAPPVTV